MSISDITGQFSDRRCKVRQIELFFVICSIRAQTTKNPMLNWKEKTNKQTKTPKLNDSIR